MTVGTNDDALPLCEGWFMAISMTVGTNDKTLPLCEAWFMAIYGKYRGCRTVGSENHTFFFFEGRYLTTGVIRQPCFDLSCVLICGGHKLPSSTHLVPILTPHQTLQRHLIPMTENRCQASADGHNRDAYRQSQSEAVMASRRFIVVSVLTQRRTVCLMLPGYGPSLACG